MCVCVVLGRCSCCTLFDQVHRHELDHRSRLVRESLPHRGRARFSTRDDDLSFPARSLARSRSRASWQPIRRKHFSSRDYIAQPCCPTTRWRTSLTEIRNHLSRVTATGPWIATRGFLFREERGVGRDHFPCLFSPDCAVQSEIDRPCSRGSRITEAYRSVAIRSCVTSISALVLPSSSVPFVKLSNWL